ncbi:AIDA-1b [Aphelenchoides avenae]|nr:AIDA-1b [Aphelenchus avenae]
MSPKELSNSSQDFFEYCRRGNVEKVNAWLLSKSKKSKSPLNFLRPSTPSAGWLTHLRDPLNAYTALHQAALHGHLEVAQQLVRHDPDLVNARDRRGCLPLHLAAWNGHHLVVQYLLKEEPSTVDAVNNAKECPLHLAAQHGHAYVTSVLLQNHADARLRNARFETALDIAARMGKEGVCKLLIYNCPELALQSAAECTSAENRALASHVVYPLHAAARHGHIECLSILCDAGFDVNFVTDEGSALHVAALFGQLDAVRLLLKYGCISYSAHYLGSMEISNVEGAEDCRRAMIASKGRIKQVNKVPQVILEISVGGVNVLDAETNQLTVQHEVNRIQVVCQDEIDLNCFAYIFQDGDKNFCHVYCVLTAGVAKEIIVTLGQAFNLAYLLTGP